MNSQALKGFFKDANIKTTDHGVECASVISVVLQANSIFKDVHGNLWNAKGLIDSIVESDAFELGLLGKSNERNIKTFSVLCSAWLKHADFISDRNIQAVAATDADTGQEMGSFFDAKQEGHQNVIQFPLGRVRRNVPGESEYKRDIRRITNFLSCIGFSLKDDSRITMEESVQILISGKAFLTDAFENAVRADNLTTQLLNDCDEIHAIIGHDLMDALSAVSAANRAWILYVRNSIIGRNLILGGLTRTPKSVSESKGITVLPVPASGSPVELRSSYGTVLSIF